MPGASDKALLLPASTGIEGRNPQGAKAVADILAIAQTDDTTPTAHLTIDRLLNSGQKEAFLYGSAFARGVSISTSDGTIVRLSGTASIDQSGKTTNKGDVTRQVEYTLDKVETLLATRGTNLHNTVSAVAFVKHRSDTPIVKKFLSDRFGESFPYVCTIADVCRDDLLFELEADVLVNSK